MTTFYFYHNVTTGNVFAFGSANLSRSVILQVPQVDL